MRGSRAEGVPRHRLLSDYHDDDWEPQRSPVTASFESGLIHRKVGRSQSSPGLRAIIRGQYCNLAELNEAATFKVRAPLGVGKPLTTTGSEINIQISNVTFNANFAPEAEAEA